MNIPSIRTDEDAPYGQERDACALLLSVRKRGESTYGNLKRALHALSSMGHRTGFVDGEGDGAGVQTDIPRQLWAAKLSKAGLRSSMSTEPRFWVGQCFIPKDTDYAALRDQIDKTFNDAGLNLLVDEPGHVRQEALGRQARANAPMFIQLAGFADTIDNIDQQLFQIQRKLESTLPIHFASLSTSTVVYKVHGSVEVLSRFYPDLQDRDYTTAITICHARYSTNTASSFERVQPFALLGHNGEINTISRFRQEARQIGAELDPKNSDSQDIDRTLHTLCIEYGLTLVEAIELLFPPVPYEVENMPPALQTVYTHLRHSFGPFAQGPAAIIARYGDLAVMSVDALGLRPLWFSETEKEYVFSSERGVIPLEQMTQDPRPLAPGEKMAVRVTRGSQVEVFNHADIRQHVMKRAFQREVPQLAEQYWSGWGTSIVVDQSPLPTNGASVATLTTSPTQTATATQLETLTQTAVKEYTWHWTGHKVNSTVLAATGWNREHLLEIRSVAEDGKDLVGSLGFDGPLAVLNKNRINIADYFKETVAVVTNPAIDRERESEAFSTQALVGQRPIVGTSPSHDSILIELATPVLTGGHPELGDETISYEVAKSANTISIEELTLRFADKLAWLTLGVFHDETVEQALERLALTATNAVREGVQCLILDDSEVLTGELGWLDPHLATSKLDKALREASSTINLRRRTGLIVRSASIRTLHDIILLCGFGADAVNPYAMFLVGIGADQNNTKLTDEDALITVQKRLLKNMTAGIEKVISTIGCHELRGYGRLCSAIGLAPSIAKIFNTPNYFGSEKVGLTWERLYQEATERASELRGETSARITNVDRLYPKFWKKVESLALGEISLDEFIDVYQELHSKLPVALRHIIDFNKTQTPVDRSQTPIDIGIGIHDSPMMISAMSFGSQGELAYKAYAEAAARLNILCINGEGGELPELMGIYKNNRGQQIASGRFGVNAPFLNSAYVLEIKVGQGAKPGEGGMLPAYKVTPQVAEARRTNPYIPLISPSNNHDVYSIEDLAQLIEELKTVNPYAKISVKVPVVPGIGLIAVGVAKAGADIITLTGYDGATGAARRHALQYVGLPTEIGVLQSHRALIEAGLRHRVELWCDGGMKSGSDAVKMVLLGANRIGFATMAMVAVGCTICRKCHEGTCHVGITTHIKTVEEAKEYGIKSFVPRHYDSAVNGIVQVFEALAEEMRRITAQLGATRLQDLVGRADLLEQVAYQDRVDLSPMFAYVPMRNVSSRDIEGGRRLTRPRNILTKMITDIMLDAVRDNEREATYQDEVMAYDRALGSHLAGELARTPELFTDFHKMNLHFGPSSVGGNGFGAWLTDKMDIVIEGGAQDGAVKSSDGGRVAIMKGLNHKGERIDGSVGKSFAYGAQKGIFIVQGNADSRACIRFSGADVVFGGEILEPIGDAQGLIGTKANIKGFACEYMTSGRVLIMGDPGPYAFAGMTGGVVYQQLSPQFGFDEAALQRRFAIGSKVNAEKIDDADVQSIQELLSHYIIALEQTDQFATADKIRALSEPVNLYARFVKVVPLKQ